MSTLAALVVATVMSASGQNARWNGNGEDGMWTNPANWNVGFVPTLTNDTANWTGDAVTIDDAAFADRFWSRHGSGDNILLVATNGSLTTIGDVALNEFSNGPVDAELNVNGGHLYVGNDISVAGQATSQGEALFVLNSGSINVSTNNKIGTAGQGIGVNGRVDVNGGTYTVSGRSMIGGGNLATDEGVLNLYGGLFTEGIAGSNNTMQIGIGQGNGAVNLYGGKLVNNNNLSMDADASTDAGTAVVNLYGGEWWQVDPDVNMQDESTLAFQEGVLYWSGDQVDAMTELVTNDVVSYILGGTNMLTENWDASWTNGITYDYGYWSVTYGNALFADYNDVTNGFTTVWAYNLSSVTEPAVSNGVAETHTFNNGSGDQLWTTAANWDIGTVPTIEDTVNHTANGDTLVIASDVEVEDLFISNDSSATVAVVDFGALAVNNKIQVGNSGGNGVGILRIDGGELTTGSSIEFGIFGTTRKGIGFLNSGSISAGGTTSLGGFNPASGELTINGGIYTQTGLFEIGRTGAGILNMNGGSLIAKNGFDPLRVGDGSGDGTLNLNGGSIVTSGMQVEWGDIDEGTGTINLNGGLLQIDGNFDAALRLDDNAQINFDQGVFKWAGNWVDFFATNYVDNGFITWANGMTNRVSETWDKSWTNGMSVLFAEFADGFTTVWAFDLSSLPSGYESYAIQYNLQEGSFGDDDEDGASNFREYALNGNPTNNGDTGHVDANNDGTTFSYVYAKRDGDAGIGYTLVDTTDLVYVPGNTNNWDSQSSGPVVGDYSTVTNNYGMTVDQRFIKLLIEEL
ncbi:autotransporter outer membrane beta-barrel domain-containing protein [Pontiella sulfatireligans]|nr:hypothetical protein [Pontiella sulfatireligans]